MPNSEQSLEQSADLQIQQILSDSHALRLIENFIQFRIRQYHLDDQYEWEDILHDAILRLHQQLTRGVRITNPKAWLRVVAMNRIRDINRSSRKVDSYDSFALDTLAAEVEDDSPDSIELSRLKNALQALPPEERELLEMRFFHQMTWQQIAHALNMETEMSAATVRQRGSRILKKLRKLYETTANH